MVRRGKNFSEQWSGYENRLAAAMRAEGYDVSLARSNLSSGVDLICKKDGASYLIHCATAQHPIKKEVVHDVFSSQLLHEAEHCLIMSVSGFTVEAVQVARRSGVHLAEVTSYFSLSERTSLH